MEGAWEWCLTPTYLRPWGMDGTFVEETGNSEPPTYLSSHMITLTPRKFQCCSHFKM